MTIYQNPLLQNYKNKYINRMSKVMRRELYQEN